jgi:nitronate monooxygenase
MKIPKLDISGLIATIPVIQGGMGVGISGAKLAAAVANEGGVGVIAGVDIGYREHDFNSNILQANLRALKIEIQKARQLAPKGIIGINIMVAMNHYSEMAKAAVEEGIDLIISGAGLPTKLPEYVKDSPTRIAPIVSSGKAANVILKYWDAHFGRTADMVIVEGPEAGGHLGFSQEVLTSPDRPSLGDLVKEVLDVVRPYREKFQKHIPVIAAGGIYSGGDIAQYLAMGADGVQMATRFVATDECDADDAFKEAYVNAKEEDIKIINSPVGMPGRALFNEFVQRVSERNEEIKSCSQCLVGCKPKSAPYCITNALINAVKGNVNDGLIFVGSNAYLVDKIIPVKELINELKREMESHFVEGDISGPTKCR